MRRSLVIAALTCLAVSVPLLAGDRDIDVSVHLDGRKVTVDATFFVAAPAREVWAVMTDFDHFADFISNLKSSRVLGRKGNTVTVAQSGEAAVGPIKFPFESVREVILTPYETVRSRSISGTLQEFAGQTRFVAEAAGTRVIYHSDAISKSWVPPFFGPGFVERETREQLAEFRAEIGRRQQGQDSPRRDESPK